MKGGIFSYGKEKQIHNRTESGKRGKSQIGYDRKLYKSGNDLYRWVSLYE